MGADSWEPIRVASGASNLPMEHFARSELERDDWEPGVGASLPIRTASGASSLPIEHFARSELERDV